MRFAGKAVIITGSSAGIGKATAILFAKEGADVLISGRDLEKINKTVQECKNVGREGAKFPFVQGDIGDENIVRKIKDTAVETFGRIDVLVNNAGILIFHDLETVSMDVFDLKIKIMLRAPIYLSQLCFPELVKTQGNIVNISSIYGIKPASMGPVYNIIKSAMNMFTQCAALEFAAKGVRVNSLNPGHLETDIMKRVGLSQDEVSKIYSDVAKTVPIKKTGTSEDCAKVVAFLASEDARMMNGSMIVQDGGNVLIGLDKSTVGSENAAHDMEHLVK